jgi:hypothetical protein
MHPIYEYMVGDTVKIINTEDIKMFRINVRKPFIIRKALQLFEPGKNSFQNHYHGFIDNLSGHHLDEHEIYTTRMVLIEKNNIFVNGK